jgi:pilus assembly protein CpaE
MTIYWEPDTRRPYPDGLGGPGGVDGHAVRTVDARTTLAAALDAEPAPHLVVVGAGVALVDALAVAAAQRVARPALGVVLLRDDLALDVLGEAIRAGVREVVATHDAAALRRACERSLELSRELGAAVRPPAAGLAAATVVTVFGGKGGCGKSVLATNLAVSLATGGHRVLLVDLDLQFGDVGIMTRLAPDRTIGDAITMAGRLDEAGVRSLLTQYRPGLDVLLAPAGPAEGDQVSRALVAELITAARPLFDVIVVDTPPYFNDPVLAALDLTDRFVLLVTPDLPTLKSVRLTQDMFELLEYPRERRLAVLNRADSDVGLTIADVETAVGAPMAVQIPSSRDVPVSVNRGVPLAVDDPKHPFARAIRDLADRCTGRDDVGPAGRPRRLRFLGRRG